MKFDEAEALIKQTLARYPNDLQLKFELSRHRFINAKYKKKTERDILLSEAAEGFNYVAEHDSSEKRRAWSLHFLTIICCFRKDYDQASEYNAKLPGARGIYPRATAAVIQINKAPNEDSLRLLRSGMSECIKELSILVPWMAPYLLKTGDYDTMIKEYRRAALVYEQYTDFGWIYNDLSECYETIALAYAYKKDYGSCLYYLEKACDCAEKYDNLDDSLSHPVYDISDEISLEEEKFSSRRSLYMALISSEREVYAPVHETQQYKAVICKLIG